MSDRRAKRDMLLEVAELQGAAANAVEAVRTARIRVERALEAISEAVDRTNRVLEQQVAEFRDRVLDAGVELIPPVQTVPGPGSGGEM